MNPGAGAGALDQPDGGDADDADHQLPEGQPRPLPYAFEKELIEKSNKHIRLHRNFVPVSQVYPLTRKFYAHYEERKLPEPLRYVQFTPTEVQIKRQQKLSTSVPLLESQVYGWVPLLAQDRSIQLNFIHAPKLRCCMTIHGEHLMAERMTERPPFNGLRFLLH
ncbi:uncharacterized protein Dwil_GK16272 [Drosophila willistoni]|uniref:Uncharacterized protein n=1 Tax=Drosophila willistoni TaxID=7260 RepID=B4N1L3_DROWI|nr:uncharacterized protein LOC6644695 [Drosophila willistoni]EDW78252.1 uncharacterized protein Dwil_GK16272 [Drosophila willistoni]